MDSPIQAEVRIDPPIPEWASLINELWFAVSYLSANRLSESCKWNSELLQTLTQLTDEGSISRGEASMIDSEETFSLWDGSKLKHDVDYSNRRDEYFDSVFFEMPCWVTDALNLAWTLFDLWEYRKTAQTIKPYVNKDN